MVSRGGVVSTAVHLLVIAGVIRLGQVPTVSGTHAEGPAIAVDPPYAGPTGGEAGPHADGPPSRPVRLDLPPIGIHIDGGGDPARLQAGRFDPRSFVPRCDTACERQAMQFRDALGKIEPGGTAPPKLISAPKPRYPEALRQGGVRGSVTIEFVVDRSGQVERGSLSVRSATDPRFIAAALESVAGERFAPGTVGGIPAPTRVRQVVTFDVS